MPENACKAVESLSECHRYGVFQLGTPHFDDMGKFCCFLAERFNQYLKMFYQFEVGVVQSDVNGGRISVIGRLRTVHMIVGRTVLILPSLMSH